jgi:hypothetical protein
VKKEKEEEEEKKKKKKEERQAEQEEEEKKKKKMVKIFTVQAMKPYRNSGGIAPFILNVYSLDRRLSGLQVWCELCGVGK